MKIGEVLKQIRKDKVGVKQQDAAKSLKISQTYLSQLEAGQKKPSQEMLELICRAYKVPVPIVIWLSFEQKDVAKHKVAAFRKIKPLVDDMIKEYFPID